MKKLILFFLKPLSFLPAICMMYVIYSFSAQSGEASGSLSYTVSYKIVEIGNDTFDVGISDDQLGYYAKRIEYPVRKLAHMTEYFCLAIAVSFPFYVYGLRGFPLMLVAGLICVGFAAGDEYHQSFVDGRGPSKKDVMIDSIGAFFGIITVRIICWTFLAPFRVAQRMEERARRKEMARRQAEERERERRELARFRAAERRRAEARHFAEERRRTELYSAEERRSDSKRSAPKRRKSTDQGQALSKTNRAKSAQQTSKSKSTQARPEHSEQIPARRKPSQSKPANARPIKRVSAQTKP